MPSIAIRLTFLARIAGFRLQTASPLSLSTSRSIPGKCTSAVLPSVAFTSEPNQRRWSNCPGSVTKKSGLEGVGEPSVQVGLAERSIHAR